MLRTIKQLGITLLIASSLNIVSSSGNPLLARLIARSAAPKAIASDSSIPSTDFWATVAQVPGGSAPNRPQISPSSKPLRGLQCISGCYPKYPPELVGKEGRVLLKLVVDRNGNVIDAQVVKGTTVSKLVSDQNSNLVPQVQQTSIDSQIAQAALIAARQMKFSPPTSGECITVRIAINFSLQGTEFDRQTRERQTQNEREREAKQEELNLTPLQ